MLIKTQKN